MLTPHISRFVGVENFHRYGQLLTAIGCITIMLFGLSGCSDPEALPGSTPGTSGNVVPSASFTSSCTDLACNFDASASSDTDGSISSYDWDFGDGISGTGITTSHSYSANDVYTVILTVTDNATATSQSSREVSASDGNQAPMASFTSDCPDLNCSFDASGSTDDSGIAAYDWDLGDGATNSGISINHTYSADGGYSVVMTVTDDAGANSSASQTVSVSAAGGGNNPPSASFSASCTDLDCSFNAAASSDSDGTITTYTWVFGDGSSGNGVNTNHSYATDGNYSVVLTITDNGGASSDSTQTLFVSSPNISPTAAFSSSCTDLDCNFDAGASSDTDGSISSYDWDFGDSSSGTGVTTSHSYPNTGGYSVLLTVMDNGGKTANTAQSVSVSTSTLDGQALYTQKCSTCHGADAQGGTQAKIDIRGRTAAEIRTAINTVQQMSSQSTLTDAEIQVIADYLGTL